MTTNDATGASEHDHHPAHIWFLLDRSGSMHSLFQDVVLGLQEFVREQRLADASAQLTLVQFDSEDPHDLMLDGEVLKAVDETAATGAWRLPTEGWTADSGAEFDPLLQRYADNGLRHLLCTDIDRDGMLTGPNLDLYGRILALWPALQLQASGGVRDIADIVAARAVGCAGVVLGKALLDGRFTLDDALAEARTC